MVLRLRAVMNTLQGFIVASDDVGLAKFAFLMQALTDEVIEELTEREDATLEVFLEGMGEVIAWIGHGDDDRLPDMFRPFSEQVKPVLEEVTEDAV